VTFTMNTWPLGSVVICRFAITFQPLTDAQLATFISGQGLPNGAGVDPAAALFDFAHDGLWTLGLTSVSTPPVVRDAAGAYHVALPATARGLWTYRGYGQDGSGNPLASTFRLNYRVD
jgi:hypothetical protein